MMKKLERLKLHNLEEICVEEQRSLRGGNVEDGVPPGMIGDVEVIGKLPDNLKDKYYLYGGGDGGSIYDGANGFSSGGGIESILVGSDLGLNQIWDRFRGWSGSDVPSNPEPPGAGGSASDVFNNRCNISAEGIEFMKSWEKGPKGVAALKPYDDNGDLAGGNMTIGWGHKIQPGEDFSGGITLDKAHSLFLADLQISINDVNNSVHVSLTQEQFDALVDYSYNIGGLSNSPACLRKLNSGDFAGAVAEMDIVTEDGKKLPGLVSRREDDRFIFTNGIYNCHI
jgi:lysozyme